MSIVRESEGNLDGAIWHLERAYEDSSSNEKIQRQLQALYLKRDGNQNARIRLTSGALVRVYVRGEFYDQAISEIQSVLSKEPDRADMEAWLIKVYRMVDDKGMAIDLASHALQRFPYLYEALVTLTELLPSTIRSDEAEYYKNRLWEILPYSRFPENDDEAILVPRLGDTDHDSIVVRDIATESVPLPDQIQINEQVPGEVITEIQRPDNAPSESISDETADESLELSSEIKMDQGTSVDEDLPAWLRESLKSTKASSNSLPATSRREFSFSEDPIDLDSDTLLELESSVSLEKSATPLFKTFTPFPPDPSIKADPLPSSDADFKAAADNEDSKSKNQISISDLGGEVSTDHLFEAQQAVYQGDYSKAALYFKQAFELNADPALIVSMLKENMSKFSNQSEIWTLLGDAYIKLSDYPSAMEAYGKAENFLEE